MKDGWYIGDENYEKHAKRKSDKILKTERDVECLSSIVNRAGVWIKAVGGIKNNMYIENMGEPEKHGGKHYT